jgi:hypothetical protein
MEFFRLRTKRNVLRRAGRHEAVEENVVLRARIFMQVITANRLGDGRVVYLDAAGGWTVALAEARFLAEPGEAEAALAFGQKAAERQQIVDPYPVKLAEGTAGGGDWAPASLRERIRAFGPTIPDKG